MQVNKIKSGHSILCKEGCLKFSSNSESLVASHYEAIVLISQRHHAVNHNTAKPTPIDQQQSKVIDLTCTKDSASEGYVPIDPTCSLQKQSALPQVDDTQPT